MSEKKVAIIEGQVYEATYPLCRGCDYLTIGNHGWYCALPGEGCEYPESRKKDKHAVLPDGICVCGSSAFQYHDWGTKECVVCRTIFDPVPDGWMIRKEKP